MARARPPSPTPPQIRGILCPYCGNISADPRRCDRCSGHFDPLSRQATQNAMGPWYIRDPGGPFRPGCSYETIRDLIRRGKIIRESIIRGPTTRQFWNFAARTPTVAHLLGVCHNCFAEVSPQDFSCASCGAAFSPETDRQHLGLAPVHLLPGEASPEIIAATATDARASAAPKPRKASVDLPAPARKTAAVPVASTETDAVTERKGLSAGVKFGIACLILAFASSVGYITWRLANMVGQAAQTPSPRVSTVPPASSDSGPIGASGAVSSSANPLPAASTAPPPKPVVATPAPAPTQPISAVPVDPVAAFRDEISAALRSDTLDAPALLKNIEQWKASNPTHASDADALADLVRRRADQLRLRKTP